jgi:hypothetical protein
LLVRHTRQDDETFGRFTFVSRPDFPTTSPLRIDLADIMEVPALGIIQQHAQVTIIDVVKDFQDDNTSHTSIQISEQQAAQRWHTYDTAKRSGHASKQEAHIMIIRHNP